MAATALTACTGGSDKNAYVLDGTITGQDGQAVTVLHGRDTLAVDTVRNGGFSIKGTAEELPVCAYVVIDREHFTQVFLEPGKIQLNFDDETFSGTPLNDALSDFSKQVQQIMSEAQNPEANQDSLEQAYNAIISDCAAKNVGNAMGLMMTQQMAYDMDLAELDSVMALSPVYANDAQLQKVHTAKEAAQNTAAGKSYVDVIGVDAQRGEALKLSDIVAQGKPVIVDFWASWCGPCRREINEYLAKYAEQYKGKVNFVGIAVWEANVEDTQKAMSELPISWPVIFAGGRGEDSPTTTYGINGIPHIMLVSADGTIVARDLRGERIAEAIEAL